MENKTKFALSVGVYRDPADVNRILVAMHDGVDGFHQKDLATLQPHWLQWWWGPKIRPALAAVADDSRLEAYHTGDRYDFGLAWDWFVFYSPRDKVLIASYL